jgi:hypothetical protein
MIFVINEELENWTEWMDIILRVKRLQERDLMLDRQNM